MNFVQEQLIKKTKRGPIIASAIASRLLKRQRPSTIKILYIYLKKESVQISAERLTAALKKHFTIY